MNEQECKQHPLWEQFTETAAKHDISLDHYCDWYPWWEVFLEGAEAGADISQM